MGIPTRVEDYPLLPEEIDEAIVQRERDFQFNRILEQFILAHPVANAKGGRSAILSRLRRARAALVGDDLGRGRPSAIDPHLLNKIAENYMNYYLSPEPHSLGEIITNAINPSLRDGDKNHKEIERVIKPYRKAFYENKDWLLLRNSNSFPLAKELTKQADSVIEFLLQLSPKTGRKK